MMRGIGGKRVLVLPDQGAPLGGEAGAVTVIGDAWGMEAELIVIPASRLTPDSFDLSTRELGLMVQKFTTYRQPVAFVGPLPARAAQSRAFADFRREANAGGQILFAPDEAALAALMARQSG